MNTTLSQKHLLDITILRNPLSSRPWDISFSEHLAGFLDAIDLCQTIVSAPSDDGENFGLSDAAYVLSSAGALWSKRVDETTTAAKSTLESLHDVTKAKKGKGTAQDGGKPVMRRIGHPLALPFDIMKDHAKLLDTRDRNKSSNDCTIDKLPLLLQDSYLSPSYPHLLPLLDCERIKPYLEDGKKFKGVDWAEFRINILPLNIEGLYPLHKDGSVAKNSVRYFSADEYTAVLPAVEDIIHINMVHDNHTVLNDEDLQIDEQAQAVLNQAPNEIDSKTRNGKDEQMGMTDDVLSQIRFRRVLQINQRFITITSSHLQTDSAHSVEEPYRRRNLRKMKERDILPVSGEVDFFMNFWAISPKDEELPFMDISFILKRFRYRLRVVEIVAKTKKKTPNTVVEFISQDAEDEDALVELASVPATGERNSEEMIEEASDPVFSYFAMDDKNDYVELDEPAGGVDALQLDAVTDEDFGRMMKFAEWNDIPECAPGLDRSMSADCSFVEESDLQDWEIRLSNFLAVHETATLTFDLEQYGKSIIEKCRSESSRSVIDIVMSTDVGRNSANVCRTFLSLLDLANKKSVEFDSVGEAVGTSPQQRISEDVTQVRMKFRA